MHYYNEIGFLFIKYLNWLSQHSFYSLWKIFITPKPQNPKTPRDSFISTRMKKERDGFCLTK